MAKDLLGIDIGTSSVKFVTKDRCIFVDTPENALKDDELIAFDGMSDLIKETIKENGIRNKKVALVLPDSASYIQRCTMPYMSVKQLEVNLPYEFKQVVGQNKNDYLYDYAFVSHTEKEMTLLAGAVEKTLIEKYEDMFRKAGLKLVKATPRQMAISDLLRETGRTEELAILDLGTNFTRIDIYKDGFYNTSRTVEKGVKDMTKIVADILFCDEHIARTYLFDNKNDVIHNEKMMDFYDDIAIRIARAINFYLYENQDNNLNTLYVYGSGSKVEPYMETIQSDVTIQVEPMSKLFPTDSGVYADALGASGVIRG